MFYVPSTKGLNVWQLTSWVNIAFVNIYWCTQHFLQLNYKYIIMSITYCIFGNLHIVVDHGLNLLRSSIDIPKIVYFTRDWVWVFHNFMMLSLLCRFVGSQIVPWNISRVICIVKPNFPTVSDTFKSASLTHFDH